jgi:2-polyprenyl-3-methyl-5-hydroxy-6-metoxy-1,4-benzoquinol methylase
MRSNEYVYRSGSSTSSAHNLLTPHLRRELDAARARVVLDLGCGNGSLTAQLSAPGRELYGIDASESGVAFAAQWLGAERVRCADVSQCDLREVFPGVREWDAIVSAEVIEHIFDPRTFVRRVVEALRPGGSLVITTPYHGYLKNLALAVTGKMDAHFTALWDGGHIKFWSRATLTTLLEEGGLRVVSFAGAGRAPYLWHSMILRAVKA